MARSILHISLALGLLLGCWGSALADAVCPHPGCGPKAEASGHGSTDNAHSPTLSHDADMAEHGSCHSESGQASLAGSSATGPSQTDSDEAAAGLVLTPHYPACTHCLSSPQAPPATKCERQVNPARESAKVCASGAAGQPIVPSRLFVREITPAQHAPPGITDRHLLLRVFRI